MISDRRNHEGPGVEPAPDPWIPPGANYAQAASIATGATGAALLVGDQPAEGVEQAIALLPDPAQVLTGAANILGFQADASSVWTWGLILVVLSVVLNIISFGLRYRHARQVERDWAARQARDAQIQASPQGFISGEG